MGGLPVGLQTTVGNHRDAVKAGGLHLGGVHGCGKIAFFPFGFLFFGLGEVFVVYLGGLGRRIQLDEPDRLIGDFFGGRGNGGDHLAHVVDFLADESFIAPDRFHAREGFRRTQVDVVNDGEGIGGVENLGVEQVFGILVIGVFRDARRFDGTVQPGDGFADVASFLGTGPLWFRHQTPPFRVLAASSTASIIPA